MNKNQKIFLWCGSIKICLMIIYPPWLYSTSYSKKDYGYSFIWKPPTIKKIVKKNKSGYKINGKDIHFLGTETTTANTINIFRLGLQIIVIVIITTVGMITCKENNTY